MEYMLGYLAGSHANLPTILAVMVIGFVIAVIFKHFFGD